MGLHRELQLLQPAMQTKARALLAELDKRNVKYVILETYRDQEVQNAYFAQGRQPLAEVNKLREIAGLAPINEITNKNVITKAKVSQHSRGRAIDIAPVDDTGKVLWNKPDEWWKLVAELSRIVGLDPGYYWTPWQDKPHHQLPEGS